jgi:hypothetical protein
MATVKISELPDGSTLQGEDLIPITRGTSNFKVKGSNITTTLPNSSVTEAKIADNSVTTTKISNGAVTEAKIADNSVTTTKISNGAVTEAKIAPIVATGTTEPRNLQDRFADVVNVKDFGAVGDGVADDTAAIQAAIDSLTGTIYFPDGNYVTSSTINLNNLGQQIIGSSRSRAIIFAIHMNGPVLTITAPRCSVNNIRVESKHGSIRRAASPFGKTAPDATVDGVSNNHGIMILKTGSLLTHIQIKNVDVVAQPGCGIYRGGEGTETIIESVSVTSCGGHGILIDDGSYGGGTIGRAGIGEISFCIIQDCWGHGIFFGGSFTVFRYTIKNCDVFNVARGDNGVNQPALLNGYASAMAIRGQTCRIIDCATSVSNILLPKTSLYFTVSELIFVQNFRCIQTQDYGVFITGSNSSIKLEGIYFDPQPTVKGFRIQSGAVNIELSFIDTSFLPLFSDIIDSDVDGIPVNFNGNNTITVNGTSDLFHLNGIKNLTIASGILNVDSGLVLVNGEGGVADTINRFRFTTTTEVPNGTKFTILNPNPYNISIANGVQNIRTKTGSDIILAQYQAASFTTNNIGPTAIYFES